MVLDILARVFALCITIVMLVVFLGIVVILVTTMFNSTPSTLEEPIEAIAGRI
jgi:hypothetical protein